MLLSSDPEMRELGRIYMKSLPAGTDKLEKVVLYLNSRDRNYISLGVTAFLTEKRSIKTFSRLLELLEEHGYSRKAFECVCNIERIYKNVKKLAPFFEKVSLVKALLEKRESTQIKNTGGWADIGYDEKQPF